MIRLPQLHHHATASTLAFTRVFVLLLWLIKLVPMQFAALGYLDSELFHPFGVMKLLPADTIIWLTQPTSLSILKWLTVGVVAASLCGIGKNKTLGFLAVLLTLYFGIAKGFGGHVNHRELILVYVTYFLVFMPCFESYALRPARAKNGDPKIYAACMQLICFVLLLSYFYVGMARLCVGFVHVFDPQVMYNWIVGRNLRPNPYDWGVGIQLLSTAPGKFLLATTLAISTVIEICSPALLWLGARIRTLFVLSLVAFHVGIFFLMNIAFFENIALLCLLWNFTPILENAHLRFAKANGKQLFVSHSSVEATP